MSVDVNSLFRLWILINVMLDGYVEESTYM